ncbi:MAG: PrgI family protein [Candidatus Paceibacterota bacterium]|jgi:hypothetical protein
MRYQVPQFIEMEDKIVGPFSFKQFIYLASVPVVCYVLHYFVEVAYVILVGVIFFPFAVMLAFSKVNGKPFMEFIKSLFKFIRRPQAYVWRRLLYKTTEADQQKETISKDTTKRIAKKETNFKKIAEMLDSKE